jgi:hypothetical protein
MQSNSDNSAAQNRTPAQLIADESRREKLRGNNHAARAKVIRDALRKALYRRTEEGVRKLDALAEQLVADALVPAIGPNVAGIVAARREVIDRIAGKAVQPSEVSGPGGGAIEIVVGAKDVDVI